MYLSGFTVSTFLIFSFIYYVPSLLLHLFFFIFFKSKLSILFKNNKFLLHFTLFLNSIIIPLFFYYILIKFFNINLYETNFNIVISILSFLTDLSHFDASPR
jgi:hypothetical protein